MDLELINFQSPTEVRTFDKGRFELYKIGPMTLGRATYEPGWKWSEHVGQATGETSCQVEHVGYVLSGRMVVRMDDGSEQELAAGEAYLIRPGHDAWTVGDEACVVVDWTGFTDYAKRS